MVVAQTRDILAWAGGGGGGSYARPVPGAATVPEAQGEIQYGADVKRYQKNAGAQDTLPASDYLHQSLSALMNVLELAGTPVRIRYLEHRNAIVNAVDLYHAPKVQTYCSQVSTSTTVFRPLPFAPNDHSFCTGSSRRAQKRIGSGPPKLRQCKEVSLWVAVTARSWKSSRKYQLNAQTLECVDGSGPRS
jgi:hypothetical protein